MRSTESEDAPNERPSAPARPPGIGLSVVAMAALLLTSFLRELLQLWSGGIGQLSGERTTLALVLVAACGLASITVWQYWKGRNWARMAVLLWAVVAAAQGVAFLSEHSLTALMARPLNFFSALFAMALLYWLNTPPVRIWFRKLSSGPAALIAERLVGRLCTGVEYRPADAASPAAWRISFEHGAEFILHCPWRIVLDNNLAFAYAPAAGGTALSHPSEVDLKSVSPADLAPNPAPDSPAEARRLLKNLRVTALRIPVPSADLVLTFEMGIELQSWQDSALTSRLPQWQYSDATTTVMADEQGIKPYSSSIPAPEPVDQRSRQ